LSNRSLRKHQTGHPGHENAFTALGAAPERSLIHNIDQNLVHHKRG